MQSQSEENENRRMGNKDRIAMLRQESREHSLPFEETAKERDQAKSYPD